MLLLVIAQEKRAAVLPHLLESAEDFLLLICRENHSVICEGRCRAILGRCAKREMTRGHHLLFNMVVVVVEVLKKPDLARLATPLSFIHFLSIFIAATEISSSRRPPLFSIVTRRRWRRYQVDGLQDVGSEELTGKQTSGRLRTSQMRRHATVH